MMNYIRLIALSAVITLLFNSCTQENNELQTEIDSIISELRPDKRVAVLDIEIEEKGTKNVLLKGETTLPEAKDKLLNHLNENGYQVVDSIQILPEPAVKESPWALINLSAAQLRSKPSNSSELVSQAILGTPVKILKQKEGWFLVQTPDEYISWIKKGSLSFLTNEEWGKWKQSEKVVYMKREGMVADKNGNMVADITLGSIVQKLSQENDRVKIILPHGPEGYLKASEVIDFEAWKKDTIYTAEDLINDGKELLGIPYLWGGTSSKAADCSGFIKTIFFKNGIILARDASQQIKYGDTISIEDYSNFKEGDLLFFGFHDPYRVTHVAMYIGDTEYIQAAGRVKINSLDSTRENFSDFRIPMFLGARRYLGKNSQKGILFVKDHPWY